MIAIAAAALLALSPQEPAPPKEQRKMNRLAKETSPYLQQHRYNPVDWYPWGPEALAKAKKENKVIFLSIGYSACHWCHVMERESFESEAIAKKMNEFFICIKVDREERPDIDEIYMAATVGLTGSGGWPMSVWMTPDLKPFFAGTYFPPEDRFGRPGFPRVLDDVHKAWKERPDAVREQAKTVTEFLTKNLNLASDPADPKVDSLTLAFTQSEQRYDADHGGFANPPHFAPKFPHSNKLSLLLRHHVRTKDAKPLAIVENTLEKMAHGGIYDQLRGGFHRYSTDRVWLAPHFEKMLYDNSLLVRTYAEAHTITQKPLYRRIVTETLDYMLAEMQGDDGGFYSTQDADSEGEEGKFFVWSQKEIEAICGADARFAILHWGVLPGGNWEGHNILHVRQPLADVAKGMATPLPEVEAAIARCREKLLAARATRIRPGTDDKILAAWNGLAIAACAKGHQLTGDERYLEAARRAADFVLTKMMKDGRLLRTSRDGHTHLMAYLEDYAFLADGLMCLFESDFDPRWLSSARDLAKAMDEHFRDEADGNFFFTADDHEKLITRSKSTNESSTPSGIAMAAMAHLRLGLFLGDEAIYGLGHGALRANHRVISQSPIAAPSLMQAVDLALGDPREVVIAGEPDDPAVIEVLRRARSQFEVPTVVTLIHAGNREALEALSPVYRGKDPVDGEMAVYVCRRGVCDTPITDPKAFTLGR